MSFYSSWFKQTVNSGKKGSSINAIALQADLTPAQVTVSTIGNRFVYNMEYKPVSPKETMVNNKGYRSRESTASSSSSSSSNKFAAANVVAARFQNRHTRRHSRQISSESQAVSISEDSMWEDWIVKYINEDNKQTVADDAPLEEWIFETTM